MGIEDYFVQLFLLLFSFFVLLCNFFYVYDAIDNEISTNDQKTLLFFIFVPLRIYFLSKTGSDRNRNRKIWIYGKEIELDLKSSKLWQLFGQSVYLTQILTIMGTIIWTCKILPKKKLKYHCFPCLIFCKFLKLICFKQKLVKTNKI